MKKILLITAAVIIIAVGGYFGYSRFFAEDSTENAIKITQQNIYKVKTGTLKNTISVSGNIYPIEEQGLTFSTSGKIESVNIEDGDSVLEDDILIELKNNQAQLEYFRAENNYNNAKINGSPNAVKEAELNYEISKENLENTKLEAPYSGVITELLVQTGDYINSGQSVATLIDNSSYEVKANIDESDLADLKIGQDVEISMEALPGQQLTGKLTEISSQAVSNSGVVTIPITILIDEIFDSFKPGLSADMEIIVDKMEDQVIIPLTAVLSQKGKKMVQKVVDDQIEMTEIDTGLTDGLKVAVLSGLSSGDTIILNIAATVNSELSNTGFMPAGRGMNGPPGGDK